MPHPSRVPAPESLPAPASPGAEPPGRPEASAETGTAGWQIARLFAHLDWADRRALDSLRAAPDADAVRRLAHVLGAEEVWLARLEGRASTQPVWPALDLDACAALAEANRAGWAAYLAALTPETLARELDYRLSNGTPCRSRVADILLHVALHGQYHRGQVALLARAAGGEPLGTDFITFARGTAPAATTAR